MTPASLDWTDPRAVAAWLAVLGASFADLDAAASDMLLPPHERELGPVLHAKHYTEARGQILTALAYAGLPAGVSPAAPGSGDPRLTGDQEPRGAVVGGRSRRRTSLESSERRRSGRRASPGSRNAIGSG